MHREQQGGLAAVQEDPGSELSSPVHGNDTASWLGNTVGTPP